MLSVSIMLTIKSPLLFVSIVTVLLLPSQADIELTLEDDGGKSNSDINEGQGHQGYYSVAKRAVDGQWSMWTPWSLCSVTCQAGTKIRFRFCDKPRPQDNGLPCPGNSRDREACFEPQPCPINGHWSEWSTWSCQVTCGPGTSQRQRLCTNPEPQHGGDYCVGNGRQVKSGCQPPRRPCPSQLPEHLANVVKQHLEGMKATYIVNATGSVTLNCRPIMAVFRRVFPFISVLWSHNTQPLDREPQRMTLSEDALTLRDLHAVDSGTYACSAQYHFRSDFQVLGIFAVAVLDKPTVTLNEGDTLRLQCNDRAFNDLYPGQLWQSWVKDGQLYTETGDPDVDTLTIIPAKLTDSGYWRCEVVHLPTNRRWLTNLVGVKVNERPSLALTRSDRLLVERISLVVMVTVVGITLACCVDYVEKKRKRDTDRAAEEIHRLLGLTVDDIRKQRKPNKKPRL